MSRHYAICMHADQEPGDLKIVGPFHSESAAAAYGERWQEGNADNPCWQVLTLPDGFAPTITAP